MHVFERAFLLEEAVNAKSALKSPDKNQDGGMVEAGADRNKR